MKMWHWLLLGAGVLWLLSRKSIPQVATNADGTPMTPDQEQQALIDGIKTVYGARLGQPVTVVQVGTGWEVRYADSGQMVQTGLSLQQLWEGIDKG